MENYRIIEKCQLWKPVNWAKTVEAMCDAILEKPADRNNDMLIRLIDEGYISSHNGSLSANFPVFSFDLLDHTIRKILKPLSEDVYECMIEICEIAAETLKKHVPKALYGKCEQLAFIRYQMDAMALIIETMVDKNYLLIPNHSENLCVFGVKK